MRVYSYSTSPTYSLSTKLVLLLFIIAQRLDYWKAVFITEAGVTDPENFPFVLVGNKIDLNNRRQVTREQAEAWCKKNGNMPYVESSAKQLINVDQAFIEAARSFLLHPRQ